MPGQDAQISYSHAGHVQTSCFSWKNPVRRDVKSIHAFHEPAPSTSISVPKPLAFKGETYRNLIELLSKTGLKCRNFMNFMEFFENDW